MTLIPLARHNELRAAQYAKGLEPQPNGIACPECGAELLDTDPSSTILTHILPPRKAVHCSKCAFAGDRLA